MFNNYSLGTHSSSSNCNCGPNPSVDIMPTVGDYSTEDKYGNIIKLHWSPNSRFTINLTSDLWVPIVPHSKVLSVEGAVPYGMSGPDGMYVYNVVDCKCWKLVSGRWIEERDIVEYPNGDNGVLFSNRNCTTRVSIKNFRGESIFSVDEDSNIVNLHVDDTLANILMQGYYNVDIYKTVKGETKLVRRIPLSVGYDNSSAVNCPSYNSRPTNSFVTDNSLLFANGVLSVNTANSCNWGSTLPVTSSAVAEYAQPRNIVVNIDDTGKTASISSMDIYNHILSGGNVLCVHEGIYYDFDSGSSAQVLFKSLLVESDKFIYRTITVDSIHNSIVSIYSIPFNSSVEADLTEFRQDIDSMRTTHDSDISGVREDITYVSYTVQASTATLSEQLNGHADRLNTIETTFVDDDKLSTAVSSVVSRIEKVENDAVTEDAIYTIVDKSIADNDKLHSIVQTVVSNNTLYDGGVIE